MSDATTPAANTAASLLDLIETTVRAMPDRIAAGCDGRTSTYAEIWDESGRVARRLLQDGARPGELIGICVPRSVAMPATLLGILRARCAYVPLDAGYPDRRLRTMIERAALRRIVVHGREELPEAIAHGDFALLDVAEPIQIEAGAPALPRVVGDDRAYVLFTSGSTGEPKGVCVLHRNLLNLLVSMREAPGFAADDILCAVTTLSFDIAGLEMFLPLTVGARIHIATEEQAHDPNLLGPLLGEASATVLQTTPTQLRMLVDRGQLARLDGLRLFVGGEAMPRDLANTVDAHCRQLWNMYGPTETTVYSVIWCVPHGQGTGSVPIGHPIANTHIYVLDDSGQPVADGEHGELWIGGAGVAEGYLERADLTAERFKSDPFDATSGARMYRTGDVGSRRDGIIHYHGRSDDQIKLRGFRIELGDVEAVAHEDARVREAAAMVREFGAHDARLVLYVAATPDSELAADLRKRLRDALPPYMRPNHIVVLDRLQHTPSGKIDRNSLPMPQVPAQSAQSAPVGSDTREQYVAGLWRQMLGVADIAKADNFFELGGDSLLAVAMMTRVEREMGVRLNMLSIANGTLGTLAAMLPSQAPIKTRWWSRVMSRLAGTRAS